MFIEVQYQLENTGAKAMLVHPSKLDTALEAADKAGVPRSRVFLFDEEAAPETKGVKDWRSMIGSVEEAVTWRWEKFDGKQASTTTAVLNYSSGYLTLSLPRFFAKLTPGGGC